MKPLKFAENLVPLILSGEKTSTWRLFDEKDLKTGDRLIFINQANGKEFAKAEIVSIVKKILGEIKDSDFAGHEKFERPGKSRKKSAGNDLGNAVPRES